MGYFLLVDLLHADQPVLLLFGAGQLVLQVLHLLQQQVVFFNDEMRFVFELAEFALLTAPAVFHLHNSKATLTE